MLLDEYISTALLNITKGVLEAKMKSNLSIAPGSIEGKKILEPQYVEFTVHVKVYNEQNNEKNGGLKAGFLEVISGDFSIEKSDKKTNETSQIIKFSVPVYFNATVN